MLASTGRALPSKKISSLRLLGLTVVIQRPCSPKVASKVVEGVAGAEGLKIRSPSGSGYVVPFSTNVTPVKFTVVTVVVETPEGVPMCALIQTTLFGPRVLNLFHETGLPPIAVPLGGITHTGPGGHSSIVDPSN